VGVEELDNEAGDAEDDDVSGGLGELSTYRR